MTNPMNEEVRQIIEQMKTASDLMTQAATSSKQAADQAKKTQEIQAEAATLAAASSRSAAGQTGVYNPALQMGTGALFGGMGFGGGMMPYSVPGMGPGGMPGYPGMGSAPYQGGGVVRTSHGQVIRGGMHGSLGQAQAQLASALHNRLGTGAKVDGSPVHHYEQISPNSYRAVGANDETLGTMSSGEFGMRQKVTQMATRLGGMGGMGLLRAVPVVGSALAVGETAYKGAQFVGEQREANAAYQSIYGPGTSGWSQREANLGYRFKNGMSNLGSAIGIGSGGLPGADADKAFKGISAMGYSGADRSNALDFTKNNFNSMGMSVDESLQLVGVNAKEASTNLATLHDQLKNVSEMAQQAGQSADTFRKAYIQNYSTGVNNGMGAASGTLAVANTAVTAGQGRQFAGLNTSAMYGSMGGQQVLASQAGYGGSVLDFSLASQANPMVAASAQQGRINSLFESAVGPDVKQAINAQIDKVGRSNVASNPSAALQVVKAVEAAAPGSLNAWSIKSAMLAAGIDGADSLSDVDCAIYYVQWAAKNGQGITSQTAAQMKKNDQSSMSPKTAGAGQFQHSLTKTGLGDKTTGGVKVGTIGGGEITLGGKTVYDPVIGKMQQAGITAVTVQTKSGPDTVSLTTAAKDYRDQLTKGTAIIASGDKAGSSVGDQFGTEMTAHYKDTTGSKAATSVFGKKEGDKIAGMGLTDSQVAQLVEMKNAGGPVGGLVDGLAKSMQKQNGSSGGGSVMIDMTPALKKYLNITTSGSGLINGSADQGGVPNIPSSGSSTSGKGGN